MKLGQRMVRLDDGQRGVVAQNGPELRIIYLDRGEERIAPKSEQWLPDEFRQLPLRSEEIELVAWYANRALRAVERHEPFKFWDTPNLAEEPYDPGLWLAIEAYLRARNALQ
jgi:hypothetical protein